MVIKNKKGWIRIVEAIVALLIITGIVLILLNQKHIGQSDISNNIYKIETAILREVQLNDEFRNDILESTPPVDWNDTSFPWGIKNKIISRIPNYLDCKAKICSLEDNCVLQDTFKINVYAQSVAIMADLEQYNPRQLKLFCWMGVPPGIEEPICAQLGGTICTGTQICPGEILDASDTDRCCSETCEEPTQTCEQAGGECKTNTCDTYTDCTSLAGTCATGYCCSGTCTEPTCAELGGTDCCAGTEICEGTNLGTASDCSTICCQGTCALPKAILTLVFSNTVYSWNGLEHVYTHTRTFTESNGVRVTLTTAQICFIDYCDPVGNVNYNIEANGALIRHNEYFYTNEPQNIFMLTYWGTDDNGYSVTVSQNMCVQGTSFTENCVI